MRLSKIILIVILIGFIMTGVLLPRTTLAADLGDIMIILEIGGGWTNIAKVNTISEADIGYINLVAKASIGKLNHITP